MYFIYSLGGSIYNWSEMFMGGGIVTNQYRYMLDAWHPVRNPDSWHPRPGKDYNLMPSSRQVHDASYLRLKTLSVAYTLPFKRGNTFKDMTFTHRRQPRPVDQVQWLRSGCVHQQQQLDSQTCGYGSIS